MRLVLITIGAAALIAQQGGWLDGSGGREVGDPIADVMAVKCGHMDFDARTGCVERYHAEFDSGDLDPLLVLRQHCTRWENPWQEGASEPPAACMEKFGGWVES